LNDLILSYRPQKGTTVLKMERLGEKSEEREKNCGFRRE